MKNKVEFEKEETQALIYLIEDYIDETDVEENKTMFQRILHKLELTTGKIIYKQGGVR